MSLYLKGIVTAIDDNNVSLLVNEGKYTQKIGYDSDKVKNKEGLKKVLQTPLNSEVILGVLAFSIHYKEGKTLKSFIKYVLNGEIVE